MIKPVVVGGGSPGSCECPADGGIGGQCQTGEYCPEGAYEPIPCDPGKFYEAFYFVHFLCIKIILTL